MSNTSLDCNVVNFQQKRREHIIRELIKRQTCGPEEIAQILGMHEFLLQFEDMKIHEEEADEETLLELEIQLQPIKEKFDELFEIVK